MKRRLKASLSFSCLAALILAFSILLSACSVRISVNSKQSSATVAGSGTCLPDETGVPGQTSAPGTETQVPSVTTEIPAVTTVKETEAAETTASPEDKKDSDGQQSDPDFDDPLAYSSFYSYENLDNLADSEKMKELYQKISDAAVKFTKGSKNCTDSLSTGGKKLKDIPIENFDYDSYAVAFTVTFGAMEQNSINTAWASFRNDNPLYFWMANTCIYYIIGDTYYLPILIDIDYAQASVRNALNEKIYSEAESVYNTVKTLDSYHTALTVHNLICNNISYTYGGDGKSASSNDAHSIAGYFKRTGGVCECYARTFQLFMNLYGVDNILVNNTQHAFNMIKPDDGNWYWVDVTYDDQGSYIITNYFCKNDTEDIWKGSGYSKPDSYTDNTFLGASGHEILPAGGPDYVYSGNTYAAWGLFYIYELPERSKVKYVP